jgi:hypothetical protein
VSQALGGVGTYTPLDSQPCRLLQCNRDVSTVMGAGALSIEALEPGYWPGLNFPLVAG